MSETVLDFAIFGSSPLAGLLAGLLASGHGKRVACVGESAARYRLPRSIDLSIAPITRPETWSLLAATSAETQRLLTKIAGRNVLRHIAPILFSDEPFAHEALGHVAHMARANGCDVQPLPPSRLGAQRTALSISDALTLHRPTLEAGIDTWLGEIGVRRYQSARLGENGSAHIDSDGDTIEARCAVLVDDAAILGHLPRKEWPALLKSQSHSTVLAASGRHLASPVMLQLETGTTLVEHEEGGMAAFGPGSLPVFSAQLSGLLTEGGQLQQVGQVGYEAILSLDGAPLVGPTRAFGPTMVANLGPTAAFIAPVLARWLAGRASDSEAEWCVARRPDRSAKASQVAEFCPYRRVPT